MDKTGTLTNGEVNIYEVLNYTNDIEDVEIMQIVGSLERHSTHPIAYPFVKYLDEIGRRELEVEYFEELPGIGIRGKVGDFEYYVGNGKIFEILGVENKFLKNEERLATAGCSIMYVIKNFQVIALIGVKDTIRKGSYDAMAELFKMDKKFIMLTGDNGLTAKTVANELNIYRVIANVLPKDKVEKIRDLIDNGKYVMMVGDGINDAPALATATIGVSMHSGTDIAQNSADVILMNNDISSIAELFRTSKKTLSVIKSNMFWAFAYNVAMLTIASGLLERYGLSLTPMYASMAMMFSSITVILNSFRLKR
jgi:Cu+-exporting ATPase